MLSNRSRSLFIFILILAFAAGAAGAAAQTTQPAKSKKTTKKTTVSKSGKAAPKLKPGVTGKAKTETKTKPEAAKKTAETAAVKTGVAETKAPAAEKTVNSIKPVQDAKAVPTKTPDAKTAAVETAGAAKKPETPKEKTYDRPALKPDTAKSDTAKTVNTVSVKKPEPKEKTYDRPPTKSTAKSPIKPAAKDARSAAKNTKPVKKVTEKVTKVASVSTAKAESKPQPKPTPAKPVESEKAWLPPVKADRVRTDLNGKTVADVPSEEVGDGTMNWLFANNQPKEIEILKTDANGKELVVEARLAAKKAKPNFDGSYDRVRGVARLYYERAADRWELRRVDNVSLRHSDTGMDSPVPNPLQSGPPVTAVGSVVVTAPPPAQIIPGNSRISIPAGKYQSYSFRVGESALVTGRFQAFGGAQNDIEAYILDHDGFLNWTNDHGAPAYYNSGRLTVGNIRTPLGAGTYYLVFSNRNSPADAKTVEASIQLRTDAASLAGAGYGETYNGAGVGSINTVRRVYAPAANPVPAYTRPSDVAAPPVNRDNTARAYTGAPVRGPDLPRDQSPTNTQVSRVGGYTSEEVLSETFEVRNRRFEAFKFTVRPGGMVKGTFRVVGGQDDRNIEAFIMTADQYAKWSSYREGVADYTSGRVSNGGISRTLNPGDYYIVFSNYYSARENKTIQADIRIEYLPQ